MVNPDTEADCEKDETCLSKAGGEFKSHLYKIFDKLTVDTEVENLKSFILSIVEYLAK